MRIPWLSLLADCFMPRLQCAADGPEAQGFSGETNPVCTRGMDAGRSRNPTGSSPPGDRACLPEIPFAGEIFAVLARIAS
jgi:hypothetical protein